jgi:type VI secretion system protein ImpL
LRGAGPAELNKAGEDLCKQFTLITRKFPFDPRAVPEVTIPELTDLVRPGTGKIFQFFEANLKNYMERQGNQYVEKAGSTIILDPRFVKFFNDVVRFGEAVYPGGSQDPSFFYTLMAVPNQTVQLTRVIIDGQQMVVDRPNVATKFRWTGAGNGTVTVDGKIGGGGSIGLKQVPPPGSGTWAVFRFFADADRFAASGGSTYNLMWVPKSGVSQQPLTVDGKEVNYSFILDTGGAPPIFDKNYLAGLRCYARVAAGSK